MSKINSILAIDIGSGSIKFSEFSYPAGEMVLEKYVYVDFLPNIEDDEKHLNAMQTAFNSAINKYKFKSKRAHLSISSQSTFIRFAKLPPTSHKEREVQQLIAHEAKQNVPYSVEEVTWDHQLFDIKSEDADEIGVMFVAVKNEIVEKIIEVIEKKDFEVSLVDIAPTTCFNTAQANKVGDDECAIILDIGCTCSTLVFSEDDKFYARTIPVAGHAITQQISREFSVSYEKAEEAKRTNGFVPLDDIAKENDSEVEATEPKIIGKVMTRLYRDINRSINVYRSQQRGKQPTKLYLTGGSSIIKNTPDFFSKKLNIPVEYFNPFRVVKLSSTIDKGELADVAHTITGTVGLGLRYATTCPIEISLLPESVKKRQISNAKKPCFVASFLLVISCLCLILWGVFSQKNFAVSLTSSKELQTFSTEKRLSIMKSYLSRLEKEKEKFATTKTYLKNRNSWIDLLNTIQQSLPDNTWIVELTPVREVSTATTRIRKPIFGKKEKTTKKPSEKTTSQDWIVMEAHSLVLSKSRKITPAEIFKNSLLKTKVFSDDPNEIIIVDFRANPEEANNIDTFRMKIKLKDNLPN